MTFAQQLLSHRKRLRLNQAEIAAVLSVSFRTYHDWEHGRDPHPLTIEGALARLEATQYAQPQQLAVPQTPPLPEKSASV